MKGLTALGMSALDWLIDAEDVEDVLGVAKPGWLIPDEKKTAVGIVTVG